MEAAERTFCITRPAWASSLSAVASLIVLGCMTLHESGVITSRLTEVLSLIGGLIIALVALDRSHRHFSILFGDGHISLAEETLMVSDVGELWYDDRTGILNVVCKRKGRRMPAHLFIRFTRQERTEAVAYVTVWAQVHDVSFGRS